MRLVFCPPNGGEEDTTSTIDNDGNDLQQSWKWHCDHLILGVAVKDTCVTAVYRDIKSDSSNKKKRKNEQRSNDSVGDDRSAKKVKSEQSKVDDVPSSNTQMSDTTLSTETSTNKKDSINNNASTKQQPAKSNYTAKKPAGYTFLTPSQSAQICKEINSHINTDSTSSSANYMQTYLRIPQYISTLIVPTFTLDSPDDNKSSTSDANKSSTQDVNKNKHVPKQSSDHKHSKPKQQQNKAKDVIPNSTKDSMPVDTPHGWQKIKPEQYWDAVTSLTTYPTISSSHTTVVTASSGNKTAKSLCEGAVGLFDHMNTSLDQANSMFARFMKDKSGGDDKSVLTPQAQKSIEGMVVKGKWEAMIQKLVQRTNDWSIRSANYNPSQSSSIPFWLPIHIAASHLPLKYMFSCPRSSPSQEETQSVLTKLSDYNHVAITGWDRISYNREYRRQALHQLMTTLQQTPLTSPRKKEYLILAVNDIQSILDAAREGVSIIGTDVVRLWSRDGTALCLDMSLDNEEKNETESTTSGMIDLSDERYARDSSALLPGCLCVTCRPRQINTRSSHLNTKSIEYQTKKTVPSFTRAYIHHLIKANEMLAETLLFVHNLHQMLLLFRRLSKAALLDDEDGDEKNLEAFCQKIEEQL